MCHLVVIGTGIAWPCVIPVAPIFLTSLGNLCDLVRRTFGQGLARYAITARGREENQWVF